MTNENISPSNEGLNSSANLPSKKNNAAKNGSVSENKNSSRQISEVKKAPAKEKKAVAPKTSPATIDKVAPKPEEKKVSTRQTPAKKGVEKPTVATKKSAASQKTVTDKKAIEKAGVKKPAKKSTTPKTASSKGIIEKEAIVQTEQKNDKPVVSKLKRIAFQVKYHTSPGQSLYVTGNHTLLGNNNYELAFPLSFLNDEYWFGTLDFTAEDPVNEEVVYNYLLKNNDGTFSVDWGNDKIISPAQYNVDEVLLLDTWNPSSLIENTFYTEPFQEVLLKGNLTDVPAANPERLTHTFRVKAPLLDKGQALCIIGSDAQLGEWTLENPLLLSRKPGETWHTVSLDLSNSTFPVSYKYGLFDTVTSSFVGYEAGDNRVIYNRGAEEKLTVVSDGFAGIPYKAFKGAGIAIPVFSLRSENSFGVGEFSDIKLLVDWAKQVGMKLIQILPVNDTTATHTFTDSYPYAAISAFALHPLYLHLPSIVNKQNKKQLDALEELRQTLNDKTDVDYLAVMAAKWDLLKQIFPSQKEATFKSNEFHSFFVENAHWLVPYAAFSYYREKYKTSDFSSWETNQQYNAEEINAFASNPLKADETLSIYYYVQFHLHLQLRDATRYAHQNGIIVKGDIPIGIYRNSCDAWQEPGLYNMDMQAGAPPDDFAIKGQNWGFPTYNWNKMREDGFSWWKKRFNQMSYYFDAFRIDHILGFFRIWSIPMNAVEGIMGHFVPAVPVHINEFYGRGVHFDRDRFCNPFIIDSLIHDTFGEDAELVKKEFLNEAGYGYYTLKQEYNTQRKVEAYFAALDDNDHSRKLKQGLYDLISNIILFEQEGSEGQQFHFRIAMESTSSFQNLDGHTQSVLRDLYLSYFFRRQDNFWAKEAMLKLPELKRSTNMLICGEDLGMVPECVPGVMKDLAILSLEIQRMPKDPKRQFFHPNDAPYMSVVTPSTHDMSTIRGWWEEDRAVTQNFFNNELGQWGTAPYFCEPWISRIILLQHFYSPAMWSIFQMQDLFSLSPSLRRENPNEERINIPAEPKHYWRYRMHITLENLLNETEFNNEIKQYVLQSNR